MTEMEFHNFFNRLCKEFKLFIESIPSDCCFINTRFFPGFENTLVDCRRYFENILTALKIVWCFSY